MVSLSFDKAACNVTMIEQVYIFVGGWAVVWVSVQDLRKKFKEIKPKEPTE